jgi:class 3 adenylate cyclase
MTFKDDIARETREIFRGAWTERQGDRVPAPEGLGLGNDGVKLDGAVLYADMHNSTGLVESLGPKFAAEIYKTFLLCAGRIIRSENGTVTAYDGDRIMAVYIGPAKLDAAVRTALKLNWAVKNIVNVIEKEVFPKYPYAISHIVGIDRSELLVARTGFRGSNDLVWVGRAANFAAKLTEIKQPHPTWITAAVYEAMGDSVRLSSGTNMWKPFTWNEMSDQRIYASTYWWSLD